MKYRSNVGWWYLIVTVLFTYFTLRLWYFTASHQMRENAIPLLLFMICDFIILLPDLFNTYYILYPENIHIKSGYLYCKEIQYVDIVKIRERKTLFAPAGLSMDRIEITYKDKDSLDVVAISPKKKQEVKEILYKRVKSKYKKHDDFYFETQNDINKPVDGIIN